MNTALLHGEAICSQVDPELWFAEPGEWTRTREAKRLCRTCPLIAACRAWALAHPGLAEFGVWGGLTPHERSTVRRKHRQCAEEVAA